MKMKRSKRVSGLTSSRVVLNPLTRESGFILPLSVLLLFILGISGLSFMQMDSLERKMTLNEVGNHGAFYLANAGLERSREVLKFQLVNNVPSWTSILTASTAGYSTDASPDARLCPDPSRGCVILPFGSSVTSGLPFEGTFDDGSYSVRAFNDESGTTDTNGILSVRVLGTVRGDEKLLQTSLLATSGINLINCDGAAGDPCPEKDVDGDNAAELQFMDGRAPQSSPKLPSPDFNYYGTASNFPSLTPRTWTGVVEDNSYYSISGDCTVQNIGTHDHVVIYCTGKMHVYSGVTLTNATLIGKGDVSLHGGIEVHASLPYPAVVSGGKLQGKDSGSDAVTLYGTTYGGKSVKLDDTTVHGVVIANGKANLKRGLYTDDGNPAYYAFVPGFTYPPEMKATSVIGGSWQEIQ